MEGEAKTIAADATVGLGDTVISGRLCKSSRMGGAGTTGHLRIITGAEPSTVEEGMGGGGTVYVFWYAAYFTATNGTNRAFSSSYAFGKRFG